MVFYGVLGRGENYGSNSIIIELKKNFVEKLGWKNCHRIRTLHAVLQKDIPHNHSISRAFEISQVFFIKWKTKRIKKVDEEGRKWGGKSFSLWCSWSGSGNFESNTISLRIFSVEWKWINFVLLGKLGN